VDDDSASDVIELLPRLIHDLRNPLGAILSFAEMIPTSEGEEQAEFCARLGANAQRALHVLEDYALLCDLRSGQVELHVAECPSLPLVQAAVEDARIDAAGPRRIHCAGESPTLVRADADRMRRALRSLLRDVLHGAGPDDAVRVNVYTANGDAVVEVALELPEDFPVAAGLLRDGTVGAELAGGVARLHGGSFRVDASPRSLHACMRVPRVG
jgi:signal transduction histidine kinase